MTNEELAELKALALAATNEPWEFDQAFTPIRMANGEAVGDDPLPYGEVTTKALYETPDGEECLIIAAEVGEANGRFIASANPAAILELIDAFWRLTAPAVANAAPSEEKPYGYAYECVQPGTDGKGWAEFFSRTYPQPQNGVRNITALYAAQQAASKQALTDEQILEFAESFVFSEKDLPHKLTFSRSGIVKAVRAIEAASAPNAQLVETLKGLLDVWDKNGQEKHFGERFEEAKAKARAALSAVGALP